MKPTKELLTMSLVMVFLFSLTWISVTSASPATYFYVDPSYIEGTPTGKFQVAINVADAPLSYAWEIQLSWDPERLELLSVEEGDFLHRWQENPFPPPDYLPAYQTKLAATPLNEANSEGEILAACTLVSSLPMSAWASGDGYLCKLTFLAQHSGAAFLSLHDTRLWDHIEADYPAATYYADVDGLVDATDFFFAGLEGWGLKVNGNAGLGKGHGLEAPVGEPNLLETYLSNTGTFAVNVQSFIEIRDSAGYWLATIPSSTVLLQPGESTILSATWTVPGAGVYYVTAYSFFGEVSPTIQSGFSRTLRITAV
jgi:hypothetical protein